MAGGAETERYLSGTRIIIERRPYKVDGLTVRKVLLDKCPYAKTGFMTDFEILDEGIQEIVI